MPDDVGWKDGMKHLAHAPFPGWLYLMDQITILSGNADVICSI